MDSPTGESYIPVRGRGVYASVIPVYILVPAHPCALLRKAWKAEKRARNPCGAVVYVLGMHCD